MEQKQSKTMQQINKLRAKKKTLVEKANACDNMLKACDIWDKIFELDTQIDTLIENIGR